MIGCHLELTSVETINIQRKIVSLDFHGGTEGNDEYTQDIQIFWDDTPCRWVNTRSCKRFEGQ